MLKNNNLNNKSILTSFYNPTKVCLPDDFAQQLMHLELEIEQDNATFEMVMQLIELYRVSINLIGGNWIFRKPKQWQIFSV